MNHHTDDSSPSASEDGGPNILPIPPALEFPFPRTSGESTSAATPAQITKHSSAPITSEAKEQAAQSITDDKTSTQATTPSLQKSKAASRPMSNRRFMTERPKAMPRASIMRMRRNQTGYQPTALNKAIGVHEDEETSSSDEEDFNRSLSPRTPLDGQIGRHVQHTSSMPDAVSREGPYGGFSLGNDNYKTKGRVSKRDGRLKISVNETNNRGYLAHALGASLQPDTNGLRGRPRKHGEPSSPATVESTSRRPELMAKLSALSTTGSLGEKGLPLLKLNVVVMVIGSRGDIQPFLKIGKLLKEKHGHRVRIATHPAFKNFVEQDSGLEFFSVGGDPAELMAFMVKNPGLMPSVATVRAGEIGRKRDSMFEMFQGFWRACINATDEEHEASNLKMMADKHPFVADAIIANPPCFAHVHCAERLGVPLHLMFTFPYSPTQQFPHPLANIKKSNVDSNYTNFMSYPLVEMMTWQGLGDLVNRFRVKTLGLEPVSTLWAPGQLFRQKVPYTYMWSPGLIPKPADWGPEIDIAGFVFLDLASSFKPPETLSQFLDAGEPPVYIGFGSIVVDDPDEFTSLIFEAVKKAGIRALVSKGWGGLGDEDNTPDNIYMLENTPHDWLFPRCSAVVHHGGAGTTAIGLKCGKPTMIVPFFGDQPFWGAMVARAGAGAHEATPYKRLSSDKLAEGIKQCLEPEAREAAESLAKSIEEEGDGAQNAVDSFHRHLPMQGEHSMRCSVLPDRVAVWTLKRSNLRLSALAAELLVEKRKISWKDLRLLRHYEWTDFEGPGEPVTGAGSALVNSATGVVRGVGGMPVKWAKSIKRKERHEHKGKKWRTSAVARDSEEAATKKVNLEKPGKADKDDHKDEAGELPNGGQHGAEKDLPEPSTLPRPVQEHLEEVDSRPGGEGLPSTNGEHPQPGNEDAVSIPSPASSDENLAQHLMEDTGHGFAKAGEAFAKVPMDLSLAIAQGFHNAPRLYGDSTVRTAPRISGLHSGLRAAGSEFTLGIYDGVTGLFLQPYHGARDNGALGFAQGIGKGFGGFVLKDLAALISPFAYTMKGVHKELIKGRQPTAFIRRARQLQGGIDVHALGETSKKQELSKIDVAWKIVSEIRNEEEAQKREGVKGRLAVLREQQKQAKSGGYENVRHAQKTLDAKQEERERRQSAAVANGRSSGEKARRGSRMLGGNMTKFSKMAGGRKSVEELEERTARNTDANQNGGMGEDSRRKMMLHPDGGGALLSNGNGNVAGMRSKVGGEANGRVVIAT